MLSFKCLDDLNKLSTTDPAYPHVKQLIETCIVFEGYRTDADGWIVLIDEGDIDQLRNLKTGICPAVSGASNLTCEIGCNDKSDIHFRISGNTGGGLFWT